MSCAITAGYTIDCNKDSLGGLKVIRIASKKDIVSYTETAGVITGISMATGKQFYKFDLVKSSSNFVITPTANVQNGTTFYAEAVTLIMNKLKAATSSLVDALIKSSLVMIAEDRNGEVFLLGRDNGLDLSGGTIGSGTNGGDRNGYELQFTGEEAKISHVDPTVIAAISVPAA
jgi:hypothetical protein